MTHTINGCTVAQYAEVKQLPPEFLKALGLKDEHYKGVPSIRIPYCDAQGKEQAVRFRKAMQGKKRFVWEEGSKTTLYLNPKMNASYNYCILVEGESDCHTLWYYNINAYGVAGATNWKEEHAVLLEQYDIIYIIIEQDTGGEAVEKWLSKSRIRDKVKLIRLDGFKDPSEMHCAAPDRFLERWQKALDSAVAFEEEQPEESSDGSPFDVLMQCAERLCKDEHEAVTALLKEAGSLTTQQHSPIMLYAHNQV